MVNQSNVFSLIKVTCVMKIGADAMIRTIGNKTKKIYLGHLSEENNIKELAHMTMENQLASC